MSPPYALRRYLRYVLISFRSSDMSDPSFRKSRPAATLSNSRSTRCPRVSTPVAATPFVAHRPFVPSFAPTTSRRPLLPPRSSQLALCSLWYVKLPPSRVLTDPLSQTSKASVRPKVPAVCVAKVLAVCHSVLSSISCSSDTYLLERSSPLPPQAARRIRGPCTLRSLSYSRSSGSFASPCRRLRRPGCSSCVLLAHRPL